MKTKNIRLADKDFETLNALTEWAKQSNYVGNDNPMNLSAAIRMAIGIVDELVITPKKKNGSSYSLSELHTKINEEEMHSPSNRELGMVKGLRDDIQELKVLMLNDFVMSHANDLGPGNRNFQIPAGLDNPVKEVNDLLTIRSEDYREYLIQKSQMALGDNL